MHPFMIGQSCWTQPAGGDEFSAYTVMLLHCDGSNGSTTLVDSAADPVTWTARGDAQLTTTSPKFGTACATFDGTGDWFDCPVPTKLQIGTGDFCIEAWCKFTSFASVRVVFQIGSDVARKPLNMRANASGRLELWDSGGTYTLGSQTITAGAWTHLAISRQGTTVRGFINGTVCDSPASRSTDFVSSIVGGDLVKFGGESFLMNGQLDELRVTVGHARYTSGFTAPVSPFPDP